MVSELERLALRSKTVVVETKSRRVHAPSAANLAAPSQAERRPTPDVQRTPQRPGAPAGPGGLSSEEQQ